MQYIVEFKSVTLTLGSKIILDKVDLLIPLNQITLVMGMSGAGKTSILRLITGQLRPDSGQVLVNGSQVDYNNVKTLYVLRKKIGMVFQSGALFADLTIAENVKLPLQEHLNLSDVEITARVNEALKTVDLQEAKELYPWELSGGMIKRAALARATVLKPEIMLYDEPLAGQDPLTCAKLINLIKQLSNESTAIIVSHNINIMLGLVDYIVMLEQGKLLFAGNISELKLCNNALVRSFVGN